jgi:methionine biosynthesis protein MetW
MTTGETRRKAFVREILGRSDYAIIGELVEPDSKVLDLGCGEGELLQWLAENKNVEGRGIEIDGPKVQRAIARGVSVYQGDIDAGLSGYPDASFDYIILSQTLQETRRPLGVLREMLRVGRHAIVTFPNFGHWSVRLAMLATGRSPRTQSFPHAQGLSLRRPAREVPLRRGHYLVLRQSLRAGVPQVPEAHRRGSTPTPSRSPAAPSAWPRRSWKPSAGSCSSRSASPCACTAPARHPDAALRLRRLRRPGGLSRRRAGGAPLATGEMNAPRRAGTWRAIPGVAIEAYFVDFEGVWEADLAEPAGA